MLVADGIDWGQVLESPVFWGALMTLIGVLVGHRWNAQTKREDRDLAAIQTTVQILRAEVDRLSEEVTALRAEMDSTRKRHRVLGEKYSAATTWIVRVRIIWQAVKARLGADLVDELPDVPEIVAVDLNIDPHPD